MTVETAPRPAVAEPITPIRPSEALRLGRLLYPVRIEVLSFDGGRGACALGAIAAGFGMGPKDPIYPRIEDRWPAFSEQVKHPMSRNKTKLLDCVWDLNDSWHWSDDQIIAWLQSLGL